MRRPPIATLLASLAAHGGVVAILFFLVAGESQPSVLFVDLETLEERAAPIATTGSGAGGADTKHASSAAPPSRPAGREGRRSRPPRASVPASSSGAPTDRGPAAAPEPEPARERESVQAPTQEPRQPDPPLAIVPPREAVPEAPPPAPTNPSFAEPRERGDASGSQHVASTAERGVAGRESAGDGASTTGPGAGGGGAGGRTALATGGQGGGAPGAEYGGYLAEVRRRIMDALRYPPPARSRGLQGTVYLEIFIKSDGAIGDVSVTSSSSHPLLDEAALEAVRSLAPQPFPKGLKPRPLRVRLPVVFDLH